MNRNLDLAAIFGHFAGQPLKDPKRLTADIDTVAEQMRETAKQHGLTLRLKFPGMMYTQDAKPSRVNADVERDAKGGFRVKGNFRIG